MTLPLTGDPAERGVTLPDARAELDAHAAAIAAALEPR